MITPAQRLPASLLQVEAGNKTRLPVAVTARARNIQCVIKGRAWGIGPFVQYLCYNIVCPIEIPNTLFPTPE